MAKFDLVQNVDDMRKLAKRRAHKMVFDYIDGGADDEVTLNRQCDAFRDYELLYKVLVGVEDIDTKTTVLGEEISVPFFCGPSAGNRLFHKDGERAVAKAAEGLGTLYTLSTLSSVSIEEIAEIKTGPKWFQLYIWKDRVLVKEMLDRARAAGYTSLVLTVDLPVHGNRERDPKNGFTIPPKMGVRQMWEAIKSPAWTWDYLTSDPIRYANISADLGAISLAEFIGSQLHAGFNWRDAEWLLGEWNGKSAIKGVMRTDDAKRAVDMGFDGVIVSNHGGRQLDKSPAPIDVLEGIVDSVQGDGEVILDGGIRRSTDILTALALGAQAVSFARPYLFGLAAGGEAGVSHMLNLLKTGLERDMALLGVNKILDINRTFVR
jgi:L-lactate dehydrogenase (cytochrome)